MTSNKTHESSLESEHTRSEASDASKSAKPVPKQNFAGMVLTVLAAAIGVQNKKNLEKDFSQSSPLPYIAAGIIFTTLFVLTLILIVKVVIAN